MKIRKLRTIRLVLIVIAVILSVSIVGVRMLWVPTEPVPVEPTVESNSANATQPTETVSVQPPETEAPSEEPSEEIPETEPKTDPEEQPDEQPEEGKPLPALPFPNPEGSGDGQKEGSLENSLGGVMPGAEEDAPEEPEASENQPQEDSDDDGIRTVAAVHTAQSTADEDALTQSTEATTSENKSDALDQPVDTSPEKKSPSTVVLYILCGLLAVDIAAIIVVTVMIEKEKNSPDAIGGEDAPIKTTQAAFGADQAPGKIRVGQLHNIGARPYQEDSSGVSMLDDGVLAIVADGMGGLSGGDRVSQKIVYSMLGYGDQLRPGYLDGALERMVYATNEAVNAMLGPEGLYKSGSTLLAVLVRQNRFHWITVGDSHIYYYHNGRLVQLNEEHNRGQELLHMAARGEITYEEARNAPKKNGLTSFIGMGRLKYIDKSLESIPLVSGDRILLMTDGVFNALSDQTIEAVLTKIPDVQEAAAEMERLVIQKANPRQDNFTAVILGF